MFYGEKDIIRTIDHLGIVEAQDSEALGLEKPIPLAIVFPSFRSFMAIPIDFNHNARR